MLFVTEQVGPSALKWLLIINLKISGKFQKDNEILSVRKMEFLLNLKKTVHTGKG